VTLPSALKTYPNATASPLATIELIPCVKRETLGNLAASPFDYLRRTLRGPSKEEIIWALKDVSFEVKRGEVASLLSWG
jgi:hypothetical protein